MQDQLLSNLDIENFFTGRPQDSVQTIDYGNSHPHFAIFKDGKLEEISPVTDNHISTDNTIISSVSKQKETSTDILWSDHTFCKMPVHYNQAELGKDRLFQAAFLYHLYPNEDIVLIDAGTFLTIDFINQQGFNGGFIFQGLKTFLSSYNAGSRLPDLSKENLTIAMPSKLPSSTKEAIFDASVHYINGILTSLTNMLRDKKIILTGGESTLLKTIIPDAVIIPHLIHYSLYFLKQEMKLKQGSIS